MPEYWKKRVHYSCLFSPLVGKVFSYGIPDKMKGDVNKVMQEEETLLLLLNFVPLVSFHSTVPVLRNEIVIILFFAIIMI